MTRRMFALVGADGVATEYASPAEGKDGELYTSRLVADPSYVEVDPETRTPLQPGRRSSKSPDDTKAAAPKASA